MASGHTDVAVIGAGIVGIATAFYLCRRPGLRRVRLIDAGQPMAFTSARSGENYRNWWPHPTMTAFIDLSIDLMEALARESGNRLLMTRRGYALATRRTEIDDLLAGLTAGYGPEAERLVRHHPPGAGASYRPARSPDWEAAPDGVDVIRNREIFRRCFPGYTDDVRTILHIRRAGDISSQQLGQYMLEVGRELGLVRLTGEVLAIEAGDGFVLEIDAGNERQALRAGAVVNAAGPFLNHVAAMLGYELPVTNVRQQKIAFEDIERAIPRRLPFSVDLDPQRLDWTEEERALLAGDDKLAWLAGELPGGVHCRPDGGDAGQRIRLGWAYSTKPFAPRRDPALDDEFPEIVLHGAARLNPALKAYYGHLPRRMAHYGGYYTMTEENWPLIDAAGPEGSFVVGAMSGFGTMAACAAGSIAARLVAGDEVPPYASDLGLGRYTKPVFLAQLRKVARRSVL